MIILGYIGQIFIKARFITFHLWLYHNIYLGFLFTVHNFEKIGLFFYRIYIHAIWS